MSKQISPDPKTLRKLLRYDPESGKLFWRPRDVSLFKAEHDCRRWNTRFANKPAGGINGCGYILLGLLGRKFFAHRVAWTIHHGAWPADQIDHINGDKEDNRLVNLREATSQENLKNQKMPCNNTSGVMGVYWHKPTANWRARIMVGRKYISLGYFDDFEDAAAARAKAEIEYNFHTNHGRA